MIMAFPVQEKYIDKIPSCVHIDGTARPSCKKIGQQKILDLDKRI